MNIKIRKLTKAEALAESAAVIARQAALMAEWEWRRALTLGLERSP